MNPGNLSLQMISPDLRFENYDEGGSVKLRSSPKYNTFQVCLQHAHLKNIHVIIQSAQLYMREIEAKTGYRL